ncbi:helix-turn-helix domain-containing protein [Umezawaea sp. Da 62-37]|uniref:helix-turn-helix domain-containing protein n=1 Tax=Umezawaea sp. Da 62-37 TaxID=3075927 RepID=UPI0028F6CBC7|nr:helix-turn-helix domain-containing protein [Umezawaea sp. Da 62-37]WNV83052.1 helix-turn-helix domain-containing protein [Umezawaea sp. Da 62-37]
MVSDSTSHEHGKGVKPHERLTGDRRAVIAKDYTRRYEKGESVRRIVKATGRSYRSVHRLIEEGGAVLRARGGAHRPRRPREQTVPTLNLSEVDQPVDVGKLAPRKHITGGERKKLAKTCRLLYEDGETSQAIGKFMGRSRAFVARLIVESGGTMRPPATQPKRDTTSRRELATALRKQYEAGVSIKDLATWDVGSQYYVRRLLHEVRTPMRKSGPVSQNVKPRNVVRESPAAQAARRPLGLEFRRRYEGGESLEKIAATAGIAPTTVAKRIREVGGNVRISTLHVSKQPARRREAARLKVEYEAGKGLTELAAESGRSSSYVRKLLGEAETTMRKPGASSHRSHRRSRDANGVGL